MRIAFAGTPVFAEIQLNALLNSPHDVVVVYTQPDKHSGRGQHLTPSPVKSLATLRGIPVEQPATLKSAEAHDIFARYQVDVMIVAAYGLILPESFLALPRFGCINVHASLLPRWRGASPIQQAILAGDAETGVTLMKMDAGLDTGGILAKAACPVLATDTSQDLHDRLARLGATLLSETLDTIVHEEPVPQDPSLATHAPKITKEEAICKWHLSAIMIERQIRAFHPWPILHTTMDDQMLRLWNARVVPLPSSATPGTIVAHTPEGIIIATSQDGLLLTHAQLPNKKVLPVTEILKSRHELLAVGRCFQ